MTKTKILHPLMTLLLLLTVGVYGAWGQRYYPRSRMTYIDENNRTTSYGNHTTGIDWESTAKAGYNVIGEDGGYPFVVERYSGENCVTYIEVDLSTASDGTTSIPTGTIAKATLHAKVSGSIDNQRQTTWGVGYNNETWWDNGLTWNDAYYTRHFIRLENELTTFTSNGNVFEDRDFDITEALTHDNNNDRRVMLVVYETAEGGGYIKDPWVEITYVGQPNWSVANFYMDLTWVNNTNQFSGMPRLYDASGNDVTASATMSYSDNNVVGIGEVNYPPRLNGIGSCTVTATYNGNSYSYTLNVTGTTVSGSYDAFNNQYTFDKVGIITDRTFNQVDGVTMTINGGPTAMVVNSTFNGTTMTTLKVIDEGGYSQPNLWVPDGDPARVVPWEGNRGGTWYRFVPSEDGHIFFEGHFDGAKWIDNGTDTNSGGYWSTKDFEVVAGHTYYLYNPNSNDPVPLLHSYRFEPDVDRSTLSFKNPNANISVEMSEGSYTNEAISTLGLPVTYSITSGGTYVSINSTTGKVTFNKAQLASATFPLTITVQAQTAQWNGNPAATATYNLVVIKRSWIFNDNDLWATTGSGLTGSGWGGPYNYEGNGLDGTSFYRHTLALNGEELSSDGSISMPETKGLRFTKAVNNDRLYIAPKDLSPNFLGMRATDILIDNVIEGQVVTVDWYGNGNARLTISDPANKTTGEQRQGVTSFTTTAAGTVKITSNSYVCYIRSIKLSSPVRATGELLYAKKLLNVGDTENRTGYTITDEATGADAKSDYGGPGAFQSSNTSVLTVDGSGNVTAVGEGTAFVTATATPKNSTTHQVVTMITMFEVTSSSAYPSATTRTRTINVGKLLYEVGQEGKSANDGLNRTVPGFTLTFNGGQGVKVNNEEKITLRNQDGSQGIMTITPRAKDGSTVTIAKVKLSVSNRSSDPLPIVSVNGGTAIDVTDGVLEISGINSNTVNIQATQGSFDFSDITIYYQCSNNVDNCLNETKVAPAFSFPADKQHYMRIPGDGRTFQNDKPTSSNPTCFHADDFTYTSSNTRIATIAVDGSNGLLVASGEATITATFAETDYFAESTATYTVSNTLLPYEHYDGISMTSGQFIHVTAQASADNTALTMQNAEGDLTFGTEQERLNTYVSSNTSVNMVNNTQEIITVYSYQIITPNLIAWLYYKGQEENFTRQVQFTGFPTGPIAGFKVFDFADINNPIDLTDAYEWTDGSVFAIQNMENGTLVDNTTTWEGDGSFDTGGYGTAGFTRQIRRGLTKKAGMAMGYDEIKTAVSNVTVMTFGPNNKVVWEFEKQFSGTDAIPTSIGDNYKLGSQWTFTNPGKNNDNTQRETYYQAYMKQFMPILKAGNIEAKETNVGILVSGDMRYYTYTSGLRLNLTTVNAHIKFPVKEGMEVVVEVASSSADVTSKISNAKEVKAPFARTEELYILREGVNSPINAYFLAAGDSCMILDPADKIGWYIKSITLQLPELHFDDEIVTELTGSSNRTVNYQPYNTTEGHTLIYTIRDNQTHSLDDSNGNTSIDAIAQINDNTTGNVELIANKEGWVIVDVVDNQATGLQPKKGSYRLYVVNLHFAQSTYYCTLDNNGEAYFLERPIGYDKLKTPIEYSMTLGEGNPSGRLMQYTNENPALTTYKMTAYSTGTITVTATSGKATTSCNVVIGGLSFEYVAPALSENDLKSNNKTFNNPLPTGWETNHTYTFDVSRSAYGDAVSCNDPTIETVDNKGVVQLTGLSGHGAIRVIVTNTTLNQTARFVLTLAYPASSRKKWAFFRAKDHYNQWGLEIGIISKYVDYNNVGAYATSISKLVNGYNGTDNTHTWTTSATWTEIFRKGAEMPRWGVDRPQKGDNAFYIQETAGLQIETGEQGLYVDQPARDPLNKDAYNHIGVHNNASITIPKLKEGDYVSLNLSRVIPNNGAILKGYNVTDLRGKNVDQSFTITRSQTDWGTLNDDGSRFIPGYYTFIAHDLRSANDPDKIAHPNEFDVTFELVDEGYLDVLSVEIYDGGIYKHTMTEIKLKEQNEAAPSLLLKEEGEEEELWLEFCHRLWSTSTGPAEYVFKGEQPNNIEDYTNPSECRYWVDPATTQKLKDDRKNLELELGHEKWFSERGVEYEYGLLKIKKGYGKVVLRMNNYTVEGRYLIGYTPDYTLNVGVIPHQVYPHTWNFTNISCGEVQGQEDNVYNSISNDGGNWINIEKDIYELNTDYHGASLYVPGSELVSIARILGQKGEHGNTDRGETPGSFTPTQTSTPRGYDELNGLGVSGKIIIPASPVAASVRKRAKTQKRAPTNHILLTYSIESTNISANTNLQAGEGTIHFGSSGKFEESSISSTHYTYRCDGGDTKYVLLKPKRAFRAGDIISIKGYSQNENGGLAFWTARTSTTGTKKLVSLPVSQTNVEETLEYVVTVNDGIENLTELYVYNSGTTSFFNSVTITESYMPEDMDYTLYTVTATTLTIPDLNADGKQDWIYISADAAPTTVTNATAVTENNDPDGPDANSSNKVYKYKVTDPGAAYVTFPANTNVYQIGVTDILKDIHEVGGVGWATESRRHSIDHTLTGFFTVNDANAYTVSYDSYDLNTATVALSRVEDGKGVPAKAGVVLRVDQATNLSQANLNTSNNLRSVPLFYPAVSTSIIPYEDMRFKSNGNMMMANLELRNMTHEQENGTLDDNEDAVDDTGAEDSDFTRFMLTNIHWTYNSSHTLNDDEAAGAQNADAAGFYRLHIWETTNDKDEKNQLAANTAYMLVPTTQLPIAVWKNQPKNSAVRQNTIAIRDGNISETNDIDVIYTYDGIADDSVYENDAWYTLDGKKLNGQPKKSGLYIHNGRKVVK